MLMCIAPVSAIAENSADFESQMDALNQEKEQAKQNRIAAQNKVEQLKEEQAAVIEEKMALEERNEAAQKEINLIKQEIELLQTEIATKEQEIKTEEKEVAAAKKREEIQLQKYRDRVRAMEEMGNLNILTIILNSKSYSGLLAAFDDYGDIMVSDKRLYQDLVNAREEHEKLEKQYEDDKKAFEDEKALKEKKQKELEDEQEELEKQIQESEELIANYQKKIEEAEAEQKAMEAAEAAAGAAASNFVAQYYAAQAAAQQQTSNGSADGGSDNWDQGSGGMDVYAAGNGSGSYIWPFPGHYIITSPFGYRSSTGSYHTGVDIDGYQSMGSPIVAADGGTVIKAEYYGGYGNCVIIDHGNGMSTLYAHLSAMYVGAGSSVGQGQTIGAVGNTGTCYGADGVHLHFEVIQNGSQVDPLGYLPGGYTFY